MKNLRNYNETIKSAVAGERENDPNWSWNVKAVNKDIAKIWWGYLDYIGETDCFTVQVFDFDDDETVFIVGKIPSGEKHYSLVGQTRWDDAKTIEEGIAKVIHSMARSAHNTY